ncbi:hypothetical protein [Sorangium sp. So ce131]|uniref:hypothetical protein n=1 Tax=Sorangium sp. So ce131 TaxID=3133282 RepID=UPI003F6093A3
MHQRTSLPLLATLLTFLVALSACKDDGGGGDDPGGPACEAHEHKVFACAYRDLPEEEDTSAPWALAFSGTVTAVRPPGAEEPCAGDSNYRYRLGRAAPGVMIDLADATGNALTLGLAAPGFASSAVAVGDLLDVDFSTEKKFDWGETIGHLRVERGGELVVAVGENEPIGLTIGQGEPECYNDYGACGTEELAMTVAADGGPTVSIAHGESAEVGELTVTNDFYIEKYNLGGACNFGLSVEYIVSAARTP